MVEATKLRVASCLLCADQFGHRGTKSAFYKAAKAIKLEVIDPGRELLFLGDFNCYSSELERASKFTGDLSNLRPDYSATESGQLLLEFCAEVGMGVLNTHFVHRWAPLGTPQELAQCRQKDRAGIRSDGGGWLATQKCARCTRAKRHSG